MTPKLRSARVVRHAGKMVVEVDGERLIPYFYSLTHSYAARASWEPEKQASLARMHAAGVRLFQVDVYLEDLWFEGHSELDMSFALRMIRGVQTAAPGGFVVVRIHVNPPFWWNEAHPEECVGFADGPIDHVRGDAEWSHEAGDLERTLRPSMASAVWRKQIGERLEEFLRRLSETPEAECVIGFHVAGGIFGEWHTWGSVEHEPDTGPAMVREFHRWQRAKYGEARAAMPDLQARTATTLGGFRDPTAQRALIDATECAMDAVVDTMEGFCAIVKRVWPRPTIVGVFYGYFHMLFCRHGVAGHLRVERVLNSPVIDYLSAPQSYWGASRGLGGSGLSRGIVDSATAAGKLWLDEIDHGALQKAVDDPEYLAITRRSIVAPILRGGGHWLYDFGIGERSEKVRGAGADPALGWWGGPRALAQIGEEIAAFQKEIDRPRESVADVLVLWDYESAMLPRNGWLSLQYGQLDIAAERILRSGVAVEERYIFELANLDVSRFHAVVFGNAHRITPTQLALIRDRLARDGRTLIFSGYPGLGDGETLNPERIAEVTGIRTKIRRTEESVTIRWLADGSEAKFTDMDPAMTIDDPEATTLAIDADTGEPLAAQKEFADHRVVYSTVPITFTAAYRSPFREAGCHFYVDEPEPIWADSRYVLLHTASGGPRRVTLRNGKTVRLDLPGPSTVVLDATTGDSPLSLLRERRL